MIEIFITCWLVLLAGGDVFCYCEGEPPPPQEVVEVLDTYQKRVMVVTPEP